MAFSLKLEKIKHPT